MLGSISSGGLPELDDDSHFTESGIEYDAKHTSFLNKIGIQVLKFTNTEVFRKNKLLQDITIDPHHYGLTLYTSTHEILTPKSLSAGEKQLLAISILWGLSRASGYPLPAIIDTPLSRLDSIHRNNLVKHYFPQASHQVILLSTDEEINEIHYRHLKPNIGREYHISYQEDQQTSVINPGYFFHNGG